MPAAGAVAAQESSRARPGAAKQPRAPNPAPAREERESSRADVVDQLSANVGEEAAKDAAVVPLATIEEDAENKQEQEEIRGRGKRRRGLGS